MRRSSWSAAIRRRRSMPRAIGALVAGYYRDGKLIYAGRVGTGYTHATARDLWKRLHPLEIAKPPFDEIPRDEARRRDVHWVEPKTVIEVAFPRLDQRRPRAAGGVQGRARGQAGEGGGPRGAGRRRRQTPQATAEPASRRRRRRSWRRNPSAPPRRTRKPRRRARPRTAEPRPRPRRRRRPLHQSRPRLLGRRRRHQAGPRRLLPLGVGLDGAACGRTGRSASCAVPTAPRANASSRSTPRRASTTSMLRSVIDTKRRQVIAVEDLDGLLSLVQAGVLEVHVRGSMIDRLDLCDRIVFDIDPGEGVGWAGYRRGRARRARAARGDRSRKLREALRRQGRACGAAGRAGRLGDGQDLRAGVRAGDGGRRSRPLRRQDDEVAAQGKNLHRLSAQLAGADLGRRLFDARARRRAGVGAGDLGGARPRQVGEPVHACSISASGLARSSAIHGRTSAA